MVGQWHFSLWPRAFTTMMNLLGRDMMTPSSNGLGNLYGVLRDRLWGSIVCLRRLGANIII